MSPYLHRENAYYQSGEGNREVSDEERDARWDKTFSGEEDDKCVRCLKEFDQAEFDYNGFVSSYCKACRDDISEVNSP